MILTLTHIYWVTSTITTSHIPTLHQHLRPCPGNKTLEFVLPPEDKMSVNSEYRRWSSNLVGMYSKLGHTLLYLDWRTNAAHNE
jgi:hypothetical protein